MSSTVQKCTNSNGKNFLTVGVVHSSTVGSGFWFNTEKPLTLADLRGHVVAVDMWTAGCYNCRNTFPHLRQWDAKYRAKGLVMVGVHTPEFDDERSPQYVKDALTKFNLKYPVVMDNDYRI